jgi:hypothetical protein
MCGMRCLSCNKILSDFESTRKSALTGEYLDMCNHCFSEIAYDVDTIVREDLREDESVDEDDDYDEEEV